MQGDTTPPVQVGDVLKLHVVNFGKKSGDPMMIHKRFIIFLKDIAPRRIELNALIEIRIMRVLPNFAFAERV